MDRGAGNHHSLVDADQTSTNADEKVSALDQGTADADDGPEFWDGLVAVRVRSPSDQWNRIGELREDNRWVRSIHRALGLSAQLTGIDAPDHVRDAVQVHDRHARLCRHLPAGAVASLVVVGWPTGLEPVTFGATIRCSAIELRPPPKAGRGARGTHGHRPNGSVPGSSPRGCARRAGLRGVSVGTVATRPCDPGWPRRIPRI